MKILLALPTKANDELLDEALAYLGKLSGKYKAEHLFLAPQKKFNEANAHLRIKAESDELWKKTEGFYRVALSPKGKQMSSERFSLWLQKKSHTQPKLAFIIGGAFGLSDDFCAKADEKLSLSELTMPHRLAFLVLAEQLYRASQIESGTLYHK